MHTCIDYTDFAHFNKPELSDLMNFVGADCKASWHEIGEQLKIAKGDLAAIRLQTAGRPRAALDSMSSVFTQWHDGMTCEYSWKKLAEVLCSDAVDMRSQLPKMYTKLTKKH